MPKVHGKSCRIILDLFTEYLICPCVPDRLGQPNGCPHHSSEKRDISGEAPGMTAFLISASLNSRGPEHIELGVPRGEDSLVIPSSRVPAVGK
jgi:hypothetical protein